MHRQQPDDEQTTRLETRKRCVSWRRDRNFLLRGRGRLDLSNEDQTGVKEMRRQPGN